MTFTEALKQFPELKTRRLTLRQIVEADAAAYHRGITALPPTSTWVQGAEARSVEAARNAIRSYNNYYQRSKAMIPWAVADQAGTFVGFVKVFDIQNRSKAEIGYWLSPPQWGKGLMTEAVAAVVRFAFDRLCLHRIYANTYIGNTASQRVLEKVGFTKEGVLRQHGCLQGEWVDYLIYGLLNTDRR